MRKPSKEQDKAPMFYATPTYKLWVWEQMRDRNWSLDDLAKNLKRVDRRARATSGGLSQFLGPEGGPAFGSNTTLMPYINKLFGMPQPSVFDPTDPVAVLKERIAERWPTLTDTERRIISVTFESGGP